MAEFPLQFATRYLKLAFARAIGKSIPKIVTELTTNADDSYRRVSEAAREGGAKPDVEDPAPITIVFDKAKRRFRVIDHAEGLTDVEMKERFVTYGQESADRSRGFRTRSLFGKGLRDVLFTQHFGQVKSIKNGVFYNCQFRWKEVDGQLRPVVDIKAPARVTKQLQEALDIPANGTMVEFQLAEGVHKPQPDRLLEKLSRFYLLRMINTSPHRQVVLKVLDSRGKVASERQLSYSFPKIEVMDRIKEDLQTEDGAMIHIEGEIGLCEKEFAQGEVGYEDREGGLLVLDEDDAVLDLCLFGFDEDPYARRISGTLRLIGAGAYIRQKLNLKEPEEILTETRDGFNRHHPFYRVLRDRIQPRLAPIVAGLREKGPTPKARLSDRTRERHQQAFDILNRLYSKMMGQTGRVPVIPISSIVPPPAGIAFANAHISIQAGVATPAALFINTALVRPEDRIEIVSDCAEITVSPGAVSLGEPERGTGAQVKIVHVKSDLAHVAGKVIATWKQTKAVLDVTTTEREVVTPVNGLEFDRDEYAVRLNRQRHLRLFADVDKVPVGAEIAVTADGAAVKLASRRVTVQQSHLVTARVAQVDIAATGIELSEETMVSASYGEYLAGTKVAVVQKEKQERGKGGIFKDSRFEAIERKVQSLFVPEGSILINTRDPVNQRYFGSEPNRAVEEHAHCQVRLADLILNECLQKMVSDALETGKLDRRWPNNPETDIRIYVDEKKFEIGPEIHNLLVTKV